MKTIKRIYLSLIVIFLYAPIIVLIVFSFNESKNRTNWTGFTFNWYSELFQDAQIMSALKYTLIIALLAAIIATVIGTFTTIRMYSMKKTSYTVLKNITYLPVINPDIVTAIGLMILFVFLKVQMGFTTMLLAHITFSIPYVILSILPKIRQIDISVYEAALDLGASKIHALYKVILPEIMPGIITGFLLAFTLSVDDFVISYFTSGNGVSNLSMVIFSMARKGINPKINALSTLMFASVIVLLLIINSINKKNTKKIGGEK